MSISIRNSIILCGASFLIGLILGMGATKYSDKGLMVSPVASATKESIRMATYHGIDVSHHQGSIDWNKVATDTLIQFVYIKATEGATHRDKMYEYNLKGARNAGLRVGSYHYLRKTSSIRQQFRNFTKAAQQDLQDLIPMVDVEEEVPKDSIRLFCQLLTEYYGIRPAIYGTNRSYNNFCAPEFNDYVLMIGRYGTKPPIISGPSHYDIWQYSETGVIPGIPKPVDLDRLHPEFDFSNLLMR
jgi:lysozyme